MHEKLYNKRDIFLSKVTGQIQEHRFLGHGRHICCRVHSGLLWFFFSTTNFFCPVSAQYMNVKHGHKDHEFMWSIAIAVASIYAHLFTYKYTRICINTFIILLLFNLMQYVCLKFINLNLTWIEILKFTRQKIECKVIRLLKLNQTLDMYGIHQIDH